MSDVETVEHIKKAMLDLAAEFHALVLKHENELIKKVPEVPKSQVMAAISEAIGITFGSMEAERLVLEAKEQGLPGFSEEQIVFGAGLVAREASDKAIAGFKAHLIDRFGLNIHEVEELFLEHESKAKEYLDALPKKMTPTSGDSGPGTTWH